MALTVLLVSPLLLTLQVVALFGLWKKPPPPVDCTVFTTGKFGESAEPMT